MHSNVRDIVKQIKNGEKNKPDAILELREVLKQSRAKTGVLAADQMDGNGSIEESVGDGNKSRISTADRTQFTRESRHAIISQIIEKKKQQRQMHKNPESTDNEDMMRQYPVAVSRSAEEDRGRNTDDNDEPRAINTAFPTEYSSSDIHASPQGGRQEYWPSNSYVPQQRPQSASRALPRSVSAPRQGSGRRSADDNILDNRNMRVAQYEARLRNDVLKECTFQPRIKALPAAYGSMKEKDTPFISRVQHWQREKEVSAARRKSVADRSEVIDCTFQPRINRISSRAAREARPVDDSERISDRLYRASGELAEVKAKFLDDERRRQSELEVQDCTFQPELKTNARRFQHVTPKFDRQRSQEGPAVASMNKDYTFTPKVRGVRKSMDSAALYVSTNVVERLTRPFGSSNQQSNGKSSSDELNRNFDSDRPVMDMAAFMGSLGGGVSSGPSSFSAAAAATTPRTRPSSAPRERSASRPKAHLTDEDKEERRQSFEAFLHRNTQTEVRKKKHVGDMVESTAPKFTPELCRKSLKITSSTNRGDFLERLERDNQRRIHETAKKIPSGENFPFQPELTKRAEKMRPRTSYELSRGDLLKKETSQRMLKLKMEQEELKKLTFKPEVSKRAQNMKSTLMLQEDPDGYVSRQLKMEKDKEAYRLMIIRQREANEIDGCTFAPATKDCPAYVKRIARSLSIVKSARLADAAPPKPEWR